MGRKRKNRQKESGKNLVETKGKVKKCTSPRRRYKVAEASRNTNRNDTNLKVCRVMKLKDSKTEIGNY